MTPLLSPHTRPRLIFLAVAAAATAVNCVLGPRLYPHVSLTIAGGIAAVTFCVWIADAIAAAGRMRPGNRSGTSRR